MPPRKTPKGAGKPGAAGGRGARGRARVRMYRHGLGDCFLLSFREKGAAAHVLIDCGTLGTKRKPRVTLEDVLQDVKRETGGHLDVVVATHEHQDHVSGFRPELFEGLELTVGEVWVAWTEHPEQGKALAERRGDLLRTALHAARAANAAAGLAGDRRRWLEGLALGLGRLASFHGATADVLGAKELAKSVDDAMDFACGLVPRKDLRFLSPGAVVALARAPGVKAYVLGPPRDPVRIGTLGEHGSRDLYELTRSASSDLAAAARCFAATHEEGVDGAEPAEAREELERRMPFDPSAGVPLDGAALPASYTAEAEAWRRIDHDWLSSAADLAVQLDNETNNTSLVLAFELDGGDVLLFAADAQLGSWQSWKDVEPEDGTDPAALLRRTIFYKVGHHSSHNATMKEGGLEAMKHPSLTAFIPLDEEVAKNRGRSGWTMPAPALYTRLVQKTGGWVLRSDTGWPTDAALAAAGVERAKQRGRVKVEVAEAWVDLTLG